ncbi:hypothetical protein PUN71_011005 [Arthrobacter sp. NQ7]|uniref:hypothetical protein n=1 Tax=Arthrobacter sp. NQ7 TaxID=3032303 RepID=UPI00240EC888|nr:hypothetical protein [Arthrobacter sp. NQ7]MDJ0457731.1 hypothetical protein [Arthrobacter sp. NQ7]
MTFDWLEPLAHAATVVAVLFLVPQLIGARAAKHRDFENLYVQRYWNLMDNFEGDAWTEALGDDQQSADKARVNAYLHLCEDELDLRRNGFVSTKTWDIWADGIGSQCRLAPYTRALDAMNPNELPTLRHFLATGEDPLKMFWWRKWWTGLGLLGRKKAPKAKPTSGRKTAH